MDAGASVDAAIARKKAPSPHHLPVTSASSSVAPGRSLIKSTSVRAGARTLTRINNASSRPGIPTAIKVNRQGCAQLGKIPDATRAVMAATTAPPTMNEPPAPIMPEAKKIDIGKARAFGENRSEIIEVAAGDRVASPIATPILQTKSHCSAVAKPAEIVSRLQAVRDRKSTCLNSSP